MRKMVSLALLMLIWFASAGAGAWLIMNKTELVESPIADGTVDGSGDGVTTEEVDAAPQEPEKQSTLELPIPVRTKPISADEAFRLSAKLRGEQEALRMRAEQIEKEESRLQIIRNDISLEKQEIDSLLSQVESVLQNARQVVDDIQLQRQELGEEQEAANAQLQQLQVAKAEEDLTEKENLKQMSRWFQGMTPENAAQILRDLGNNGGMDAVIKMLSNIEDREVAKILTAVEDTDLVADIVERFSKLPRAPKKKRR